MRRGLAVAVAVTAIGAVVVGTALSAVNARVAGDYKFRSTVIAGDNPEKPPGTVVVRTNRFRPLCRKGPCKRIRLVREAPGGFRFTSILRLKRRGVYKGKEGPIDLGPGCRQTAFRTVRVVRRRKGRATRLRGRASFTTEGTTCEYTFERVRFTAKRVRASG